MQPSDSHETAQENVGRPTLLLGFIPLVPLAFLGLGIYRAWIEIAFVGSFTDLPAHAQNIFGESLGVRDLFDGSMVAASFACALFAKQIGPFFDKKPIYAISSLLLVLSTVLVFSTRFFPESSLFLGSFAAVAGGVGIAFLILLWSELYGCLNPLRVATYYSLSIVVGAIVIYIWHGFMFPWLFVMTALLPLVSILCVYESFRQLPSEERPQNTKARLSIPWKAIILMSIYAFAYGLLENTTYSGYFGPHSAPGTLAAGAVVFFAVAARGRHFDFGMIYRLALPLTVAALLLIPAFNILSEPVSSFCVSAGYTAVHTRHGHHRKPMLSLWSICHSAFRDRARRAANFHDCRARSKRPGAPSRKQRRSVLSRIDRRCGNGGNFDYHVGARAFKQLGHHGG